MGRSLSGAALMGVGGVFAGGCTVGAGLSGVATLSVAAMIALGSIVAGMLIAGTVDAWAGRRIPGLVAAQRIFCPVFSQSFRNPSSPLSVSTWFAIALMTPGGAVATSAPISAACFM
jgi:hypothetical protein